MTRLRPRTLATIAAVTALVGTACSGDPATDVTASRSATPTAAATTAAPTPTPTSSPTPTSTTTASPTDTDTEAATASPTPSPVVAEPTGLGVVDLGDPEDDVVAEMNDRFGSPDQDSGWTPAGSSPFGVCPGAGSGAEVRGVRWGGIRLLFSDADTPHGSAGTPHLMHYALLASEDGGQAPATAEGIGLGSPASDLQDAYGDDVTFHPADEVNPDHFWVERPDGRYFGHLDAPPPDGTVTLLSAGRGCGE